MEDYLILHKEVDMSVLREGFSIPVAFQAIIYEKLGFRINRGESIPITILINGEHCEAIMKNNAFDREKYPTHPDVLQIRYSPSSITAKTLQAVFSSTAQLVEEYLVARADSKTRLTIPEGRKEYLVLYATPVKRTLLADCITSEEYSTEKKAVRQFDERTFEEWIDTDTAINAKLGIKKIRKLSKAVGNNLKAIYGYRCQICGEYIGEPYGSNLFHAHHIDYFTRSLNNNAENIMIVCPNHHAIIHDKNPEFDRGSKSYLYPNGYREGLKLNFHI